MNERRLYPRIKRRWAVILQNKKIGYVKDISLTGIKLHIDDIVGIKFGNSYLTLELSDKKLNPAKLQVKGSQNKDVEDNSNIVLQLESLDKIKREAITRYLDRGDELEVQIHLY